MSSDFAPQTEKDPRWRRRESCVCLFRTTWSQTVSWGFSVLNERFFYRCGWNVCIRRLISICLSCRRLLITRSPLCPWVGPNSLRFFLLMVVRWVKTDFNLLRIRIQMRLSVMSSTVVTEQPKFVSSMTTEKVKRSQLTLLRDDRPGCWIWEIKKASCLIPGFYFLKCRIFPVRNVG